MSSGEKQAAEKKPEVQEEKDPVSQCIGEFGWWQLSLTFLLSLFNLPCTFHIFAPTFEALEIPHWCGRPPALAHLPLSVWIQATAVYTIKNGKPVLDPCLVKSFNESESDPGRWTTTEVIRECTHWEYNTSFHGETIVSEWDLVCSRKQLNNLSEMMFLLGVALGGLASGFISDRFGRKKTLMISLLGQVTLASAIAVTPWLEMYIVLRAILGFFSVSIVFSGFVLCMELVGGKWLTISGVSYLFPVPLSYILISSIAYCIRGWRHLQLAITLPATSLLLLWWMLPESPRWLLAMGRVDEAMVVLEEAAKFNKKKLPPNASKILKGASGDEGSPPPKSGLLDLFRTPRMRKISLVLYVVWFSVYMVYYGLVLNLANLGGNIYLNSIISGAVEFPAIAISILILLKMGRRWPLCLTLLGSGLVCLLTIPVPKEAEWGSIALAMIGKLLVSSSNVVVPVFTAELFPTVIRNLGVGSSNAPAGLALLIVPYLWNLASINENVPMGVLGACGLIGGSAVLLLPETKTDSALANTIDQVEATKSDHR